MRTEPISVGYLKFKGGNEEISEGKKDRSQGISPPAETVKKAHFH